MGDQHPVKANGPRPTPCSEDVHPFNFAHLLTSLRILLLPVFLVAIALGRQRPTPASTVLVVGLFLVVCASDYWDGPLARWLGVSSPRGHIFDNLADITFLLVVLFYLYYTRAIPWWVPAAVMLTFLQYVADSWLLSRRAVVVSLVGNKMGHWAGILNYACTGTIALNTALQGQLLTPPLVRGLLLAWLVYLCLAMATRGWFFFQQRRNFRAGI